MIDVMMLVYRQLYPSSKHWIVGLEWLENVFAIAVSSMDMQYERCLLFVLDDEMKDELAGSTAVTVLLKDNKIYCVSGQNSRHHYIIDSHYTVLNLCMNWNDVAN